MSSKDEGGKNEESPLPGDTSPGEAGPSGEVDGVGPVAGEDPGPVEASSGEACADPPAAEEVPRGSDTVEDPAVEGDADGGGRDAAGREADEAVPGSPANALAPRRMSGSGDGDASPSPRAEARSASAAGDSPRRGSVADEGVDADDAARDSGDAEEDQGGTVVGLPAIDPKSTSAVSQRAPEDDNDGLYGKSKHDQAPRFAQTTTSREAKVTSPREKLRRREAKPGRGESEDPFARAARRKDARMRRIALADAKDRERDRIAGVALATARRRRLLEEKARLLDRAARKREEEKRRERKETARRNRAYLERTAKNNAQKGGGGGGGNGGSPHRPARQSQSPTRTKPTWEDRKRKERAAIRAQKRKELVMQRNLERLDREARARERRENELREKQLRDKIHHMRTSLARLQREQKAADKAATHSPRRPPEARKGDPTPRASRNLKGGRGGSDGGSTQDKNDPSSAEDERTPGGEDGSTAQEQAATPVEETQPEPIQLDRHENETAAEVGDSRDAVESRERRSKEETMRRNLARLEKENAMRENLARLEKEHASDAAADAADASGADPALSKEEVMQRNLARLEKEDAMRRNLERLEKENAMRENLARLEKEHASDAAADAADASGADPALSKEEVMQRNLARLEKEDAMRRNLARLEKENAMRETLARLDKERLMQENLARLRDEKAARDEVRRMEEEHAVQARADDASVTLSKEEVMKRNLARLEKEKLMRENLERLERENRAELLEQSRGSGEAGDGGNHQDRVATARNQLERAEAAQVSQAAAAGSQPGADAASSAKIDAMRRNLARLEKEAAMRQSLARLEAENAAGHAPEPQYDEVDVRILDTGVVAAKVRLCRALYTNQPDDVDELAFQAGDEIIMLNEDEEGWWYGRLGSTEGVFPANYVEIIDDNFEIQF